MPKVENTIEIVSAMPFYDTYTAAAAATIPSEIHMFREPRSNTKGINRTNLTEPGKLGAPKAFVIRAIRWVFGPAMVWADLKQFFENYVLHLFVDDNDYALGGPEYFPAGGGIFSNVSTAEAGGTVDTLEKYVNGMPDPRAINALENPVTVGIGESVSAILKGTSFTATADVWMRVYLDGELQRGR